MDINENIIIKEGGHIMGFVICVWRISLVLMLSRHIKNICINNSFVMIVVWLKVSPANYAQTIKSEQKVNNMTFYVAIVRTVKFLESHSFIIKAKQLTKLIMRQHHPSNGYLNSFKNLNHWDWYLLVGWGRKKLQIEQ